MGHPDAMPPASTLKPLFLFSDFVVSGTLETLETAMSTPNKDFTLNFTPAISYRKGPIYDIETIFFDLFRIN